MKIIKLSVLNYLGIGTFKTDRLGKLNRIVGDNGTGKSSVLKAIKEAFRSSGVDPNLVRVGSEKAEIVIELDDRVLIERTLTAGSNNVKVTVDGQPMSKGQTFLNQLFGPGQFNPVDFFQVKKAERRELLLKSIEFHITASGLMDALGEAHTMPVDLKAVDWSKHGLEVLEQVQKAVYERRHEVGSDLTRLEKSLEQDKAEIPESFNRTQFESFDFTRTMNDLQEGRAAIGRNESDQKRLESLRQEVIRMKETILNLEDQLGKAHVKLEELTTQGRTLADQVNGFKRPDVEGLQAEIETFNRSQKLIHKLEDIKKREQEIVQLDGSHDALDKLYRALTTEVPRKMLQQVKLPIKGLEIKGDDIFVNGVSIDTLSTSEQVRFAVSVARSLAGELKVVCIDRFESLSRENQKVFEAECAKDEFEYFLTNVTDGPLAMQTKPQELAALNTPAPAAVKTSAVKQTEIGAGF